MKINTFFIQRPDDPEAETLLRRLKHHGYGISGLIIERVIRLEGDVSLERLKPLFVNPIYEKGSENSALDLTQGPIIEVGYQPAVIDPETLSILDGAKALGEDGLKWARLSQRYQLVGVDSETADSLVRTHLFNNVVQRIIPPDFPWKTLQPTGIPDPVKTISLKGSDEAQLSWLSENQRWFAPLSQMRVLQAKETSQGRAFTDCEIEIIVQSWCDHCFHITWKGLGLFKKLRESIEAINHPLVVSTLTDNAGGMLFYDGWVICIKGETHCYPSATATFGGIATKHGGIHRDVLGFGYGAYPIGGTTIMGTMDPRRAMDEVPKGALHPEIIVRESIRGTAYYCNPMGIPMMLPLYRIHPGYPKCFALGHCIGIIPGEYVKKEEPRPGDACILFGGRTGRDGIHGATVSSAGMSDKTITRDAASVQIGHPVVERNFMTAIPILRDRGCTRVITDLGAGGISCAAGEMGKRTGIVLYLERVPLKDISLADWEILLSESQERMMIAVSPKKVPEALEILRRHKVEATVIGRFTDSRRFVAYHSRQKVVDLEMDFLWGACPIDPIEVREPKRNLSPVKVQPPTSPDEWRRRLIKVISHYHCCDQSPAGFQFDSTVQGRTAIGPYGGIKGNMPTNVFVSAPLRGKPYGAVFTAAYNPFLGEVDPEGLGRLMVAEAISKAVAIGVNPEEMVLCDNFYTPKVTPEIAWDLKALVTSAINFSKALGIPFVSGKDSSSGTFVTKGKKRIDVPYTFVCSTLGRVPDVRELTTKPFKKPGNQLVLVGQVDANKLGGSVYLDGFGERGDQLPEWGQEWSQVLSDFWKRIHVIRQKQSDFQAVSALAEGGLALRLFEMALGSGFGAQVDLKAVSEGRLDGNLFGEFAGALLFEISEKADPEELFKGLAWRKIGNVTAKPNLAFTTGGKRLFSVTLAKLQRYWEKTFKEVVR